MSIRCFSSFHKLPIRILYATETGTAQLFAQDLLALLESIHKDVSVEPVHKGTLEKGALTLLLVSTAGVGEFPSHARAWVEQLEHQSLQGHQYALFGLGHSTAHPAHYCAAAKQLQELFDAQGAKSVLPLVCGDDAGSLEDDFDQWTDQILKLLSSEENASENAAAFDISKDNNDDDTVSAAAAAAVEAPLAVRKPRNPRSGAPVVTLEPPLNGVAPTREDLLDVKPHLYPTGSKRFTVASNKPLTRNTASGIWEMHLTGVDESSVSYDTGDHLVVLPQNPASLVEAYLSLVTDEEGAPINPLSTLHTTITPPPVYQGLSVQEALTHCFDLSAMPSPATARWLCTGQTERKNDGSFDYATEIVNPRKNVLELLLSSHDSHLTVTDMLACLVPMQPRYYSIASSALVHPDRIDLNVRPIEYHHPVTGHLHRGVCTRYLQQQLQPHGTLVGAIRSNPSFRLPKDDSPLLLVAGGCGVAPIRAFLQELIHRQQQAQVMPSEVHLFLGFRDPADQVHADLVREAQACGILTTTCLSFQRYCADEEQCGLVSEHLVRHGDTVWPALEHGHTYICGGARLFGAAMQRAVLEILEQHGQEAEETLKKTMQQGRFHEDLSD